MTIVLISPQGSLANHGLKSLSACLEQAGHNCRMIFLPTGREVSSFLLFDPSELYTARVIEQVVQLCTDASLVGISLMTNHFDKARQLTVALHRSLSVPVIWGGIHPTLRPAECLAHADMVCVGEGEGALLELTDCLVKGESYDHIANLGHKSPDGRVIIEPPRPLIQDLDALPFPSFHSDNHYILHEGQVQPLTPALLHFYLMDSSSTGKPVYPVRSARGCPHRCSYCANDAYTELYTGWRRVRRRSNASLVAEIRAVCERFPEIGEVAFHDDVFTAAPAGIIEEFARLYREEVGLPFYCVVSPLMINERKLTALLDAGLVRLGVGVETGSQRTRQLYTRPIDNAAILKTAHLIHKNLDRMLPPHYDVITDNPYERTEDELETLALLEQIPRPYKLVIFSLVFFPGTALYERALADGLIRDEEREIYNRNYFRLAPTYYNLVLYGFHRQFPRWLLWLMSRPPVFRLFSASIWRYLWQAVHWVLARLRIWYSSNTLIRFRSGTGEVEVPGSRADPAASGGQGSSLRPDPTNRGG